MGVGEKREFFKTLYPQYSCLGRGRPCESGESARTIVAVVKKENYVGGAKLGRQEYAKRLSDCIFEGSKETRTGTRHVRRQTVFGI